MIYLFLAVSTAFIITVPFVPGNLTYSNLGAGGNGAGGRTDVSMMGNGEGKGSTGGARGCNDGCAESVGGFPPIDDEFPSIG